MRRTKILTTLGPATDNPKVLADMIRAGADVVRVNFSHGEPQAHAKRVEMVRSVGEQVGKWVAVLGDLQGPKIRIERFVDGKVVLNEGDAFALDCSLDARSGTQSAVGVAYKNLPNDVRAGDTLLLNDGQLVLDITGVNGPRIDTRVVIGGELSDNKGINKQGGGLSAGALTDTPVTVAVWERRKPLPGSGRTPAASTDGDTSAGPATPVFAAVQKPSSLKT